MNDGLAIDAALGALLISPLTGFIVALSAPPAVKSALAVLLCLAEAVIRCYLTGDLANAKSLAAAVAVVAITAGISYKTITGELSRALQAGGLQLGAQKPDRIE